MNKTVIKGNWNILTSRLKQKYGSLSDNDLKYREGKKEEVIGRSPKKGGKSKDEIRHFINEHNN